MKGIIFILEAQKQSNKYQLKLSPTKLLNIMLMYNNLYATDIRTSKLCLINLLECISLARTGCSLTSFLFVWKQGQSTAQHRRNSAGTASIIWSGAKSKSLCCCFSCVWLILLDLSGMAPFANGWSKNFLPFHLSRFPTKGTKKKAVIHCEKNHFINMDKTQQKLK